MWIIYILLQKSKVAEEYSVDGEVLNVGEHLHRMDFCKSFFEWSQPF